MVYRADGSVGRLREDDDLSGEDVIPGFRCPVREILPPRAAGFGSTGAGRTERSTVEGLSE